MRKISIIILLLMWSWISQAVAADAVQERQRFQMVGESIVLDTETHLMWASRDNGADIDWYEAVTYCKEFEAGGYTDWRLPDIKELASLYTGQQKNNDGYFIADPFRISDCCMWSSYDTMGGALLFSFKSGKKPAGYLTDTHQLRALPVRSTQKMESHQ